MSLNQTSEWIVMFIWISRELPLFNFKCLDILLARIRHLSESYDHMSLPRCFVVIFQESQYIIGQDRTSESKVVALWICLALWCLISSISIYYAPESNIRVKSYDHFEFYESFYCIISSVSIYIWPESDIQVKIFGRSDFPCASMFNF